jgi:two-component system phosphate regulon sensor histidine kinase PhoR
VFLLLAAVIVGYYSIVLAFRRGGGGDLTDAPHSGCSADDNVLAMSERMRAELRDAQEELRRLTERNADLSSRLGVSVFSSRQAYGVLDSLDFGIMILDAQGCITRLNRAMLELLGGDRSSYEGRACGEALRHAAILDVVDELQSGVATGSLTVEACFEETAPQHQFELSGRSLTDAGGDRIGSLLATQDVTQLKRARQAQEDFLAEAAHELLTPLTSIKGFAELLSTGDYDTEETRREFYNTINTETDRLTDLVRNLLSVSKLEAGNLDMERALVKTDWLVDQCLPALKAAAESKKLTFEQRLPDVFPTILGDKEMLKVVLINLLGNAVKYTPEGGTVRLALFQQDHNVFMEVTDTGCGIPPEELPRVFEKFYRGRGSSVRDQAGSGLGLATALQIAKLHGGTIEVQSEIGKGSCFTARIPEEDYSLEKRQDHTHR